MEQNNHHNLKVGDTVEFISGITEKPEGSCQLDWGNDYCLEDQIYLVIDTAFHDVRIKGRLNPTYSPGSHADEIWVNAVQMKKINNDKAKRILFGRTDIGDAMNHDPHKKFIGEEKKFPKPENKFPIEPIKPINWHEEHERFDQINRVLQYCTENNISPDQLIDFHKRSLEYHTFKQELKQELDDYDKRYYPK